jgi:hypothetical protein
VNTNEHTNRITTVQEQEQLELCMIYLHRLQLSTRTSTTTLGLAVGGTFQASRVTVQDELA